MKKLFIALFIVLAGLGTLGAQEHSAYSVTTDFTYASKYVFRGTQYAAQSLQPSVTLEVKDMYLGVWANQPTARGSDNEIDVNAGYRYQIDDTISLDVGATAYTYPTIHDHTTEGYVGANVTFGSLEFGVYAYRDFDLNTTTIQESISYEVELSKRVSLELSGAYGRIRDNLTYWSYGAALPVKLSDKLTATVGAQRASDSTVNTTWYTTGVTYRY